MSDVASTPPPALDALRIGVVGLGYVGLPLAAYLGARFPTLGFDIDASRVAELARGEDRTGEVTDAEFAAARHLDVSADPEALGACNMMIVTVPTPINAARQPDLSAVRAASRTVGAALRPGDVVVFESTVYPGVTEDVCVPILEETSGLVFNRDFYAGYSPERINPGDLRHRLPDIVKVTSGSTPEAAALIDAMYAAVVTAGTHPASSIKVAEAAKVIENIQRDVNIALVNELAQLFKRLGLETREVLAAAGTKWNFHRYTPGLVGGHCIGVDPYYLTHKAQTVGFHPEMILAGRRINDGMAAWTALDVLRALLQKDIDVKSAHVLVLGFTFKENCPDLRNTKVADLIAELAGMVGRVTVHDPWADAAEAAEEYGVSLAADAAGGPPEGPYDAVILAVAHDAFRDLGPGGARALLREGGVLYDLKQVLPVGASDARL